MPLSRSRHSCKRTHLGMSRRIAADADACVSSSSRHTTGPSATSNSMVVTLTCLLDLARASAADARGRGAWTRASFLPVQEDPSAGLVRAAVTGRIYAPQNAGYLGRAACTGTVVLSEFWAGTSMLRALPIVTESSSSVGLRAGPQHGPAAAAVTVERVVVSIACHRDATLGGIWATPGCDVSRFRVNG